MFENDLTPDNYNACFIGVYFELADKVKGLEILKKIDFVKDIIEKDFGFRVIICYQEIPELVRVFVKENIAIYSIIPDK